MAEMIYKYADGVEILVEVDENKIENEDYERLSSSIEKNAASGRIPLKEIEEKFKDIIKEKVDKVLYAFKDNFDGLDEKLGTSRAQLEFSISIKGEKNYVISKLGVEGQFKISLTWDYTNKKE